jgi:hypothetical protein
MKKVAFATTLANALALCTLSSAAHGEIIYYDWSDSDPMDVWEQYSGMLPPGNPYGFSLSPLFDGSFSQMHFSIGSGPSFTFAAPMLSSGDVIGSDLMFEADRAYIFAWAQPFDSYIGLRFLENDIWHYGWLQFEWQPYLQGSWPAGEYRFLGYAYESTPDTSIVAGQIPAPGALALLAMSAITSSFSRRRRA